MWRVAHNNNSGEILVTIIKKPLNTITIKSFKRNHPILTYYLPTYYTIKMSYLRHSVHQGNHRDGWTQLEAVHLHCRVLPQQWSKPTWLPRTHASPNPDENVIFIYNTNLVCCQYDGTYLWGKSFISILVHCRDKCIMQNPWPIKQW